MSEKITKSKKNKDSILEEKRVLEYDQKFNDERCNFFRDKILRKLNITQ
jgi:hypothetical protein